MELKGGEEGAELLRSVGPCPHDWLLPQCRGVVHHGGAGTVAAGLRLGLPTMVCPFFADHFMWGYFVESAGVGPKACPVNELNEDILVERLQELASPESEKAAQKLAQFMQEEDGIQGGLFHFLDSLPRDNMLCDVSILLGEAKKARYELIGTRFRQHGIKVSSEVAAMLEFERHISWESVLSWLPDCESLNDRQWYSSGIRRFAVVKHDLAGHVKTFSHGVLEAFWGSILAVCEAALQLYFVPDRFARLSGAFGCLFGVAVSVFHIAWYVFIAILIFFDRLAVGITNGCLGKDYDYAINPMWETSVRHTPYIEAEKETIRAHGIPPARKSELKHALRNVVKARVIFERAGPYYPHGHRNFVVVKLDALLRQLSSTEAKEGLKLWRQEMQDVESRLTSLIHAPSKYARKGQVPPWLVNIAARVSDSIDHTNKVTSDAKSSSVHSSTTAAVDDNGTVPQSDNGIEAVDDKDANSEQSDSVGTPTFTKQVLSAKQLKEVVTAVLGNEDDDDAKFARTEISFSMFLYCLHLVSANRFKHKSRRSRPYIESFCLLSTGSLGEYEDYTAYLH